MELSLGNYRVRGWRKEDAPTLAKYANNRKIWLNLRDGFPHPYTLDNAKLFIANAITKQPEAFFAISSDSEIIGSIGFSIGQDVHRYTAELGYWLAEPFWNQGIITKAIQTVTEYAFDRFGLVRIYAEPYASNSASSKVLEKAGFQLEGRLKGNVYKNGKIMDQFVYAKIKIDSIE